MTLREYFAAHNPEDNYRAARHEALMRWNEQVRYCCTCGAELPPINLQAVPAQRVCPKCGKVHFPRIEPCVIVRIQRDGKILLAKHVQRNTDIYACIAGFVEAGESVEHALQREIREEIGIEVTNIRYFGSQSWPFPDQLMIAFIADYASGEICLQKEELQEVGWFSEDELPAHPRPGSISYELIHWHE